MSRRPFIYDTSTKNMSFLQTSADLKHLGIENNRFFLRLYDSRLKGVDPYDPNLSFEMIRAIIDECVINPWYFLRECARIPMQGGGGMRYQLHRANLAQTFLFLLGIDHYVVIPRQKGKTQSTLCIINWAFLFGTNGSDISFVNKRGQDAEANMFRLKMQRDLLPTYMQQKIAYDSEGQLVKETNNVRTLRNPANGNRIVTKSSASSEAAADSIGRGASEPIQYFDEVEFTMYIKTIVEAGGPAYMIAARNAAANNAARCRVFTSTPGDADSQAGKDAAAIIEKTAKWSEQIYDWDEKRIREYLKKSNGIVYIEYSYTQLGEGQEWFEEQCRVLNDNPSKIKRELLLKRIRGSEDSPFDPDDLEAMHEMKVDPIGELFINNVNAITLYEKLNRSRIYMVGVDIASGYGIKRDSSAVVIFDPYTRKVVATFKSPFINEPDMEKFLYVLVKKHIPRAIVVIERNKGGSIIEHLRETDIGNQIFYNSNDKIFDLDVNLDTQGFLQREAEKRRMFGVYTGTKTRERMFDILYALVREEKERFVAKDLIDEIASLVVRGTKVLAGAGAHDDVVMAYLMCIYVYYHADNLNRWGFVKGEIPAEEKQNQGMYSYDEIIAAMPEESREFFANAQVATKTQSDYEAEMVQDMIRARKDAYQFDMLTRPSQFAENLEGGESSDGNMDLDFFNGLNDF